MSSNAPPSPTSSERSYATAPPSSFPRGSQASDQPNLTFVQPPHNRNQAVQAPSVEEQQRLRQAIESLEQELVDIRSSIAVNQQARRSINMQLYSTVDDSTPTPPPPPPASPPLASSGVASSSRSRSHVLEAAGVASPPNASASGPLSRPRARSDASSSAPSSVKAGKRKATLPSPTLPLGSSSPTSPRARAHAHARQASAASPRSAGKALAALSMPSPTVVKRQWRPRISKLLVTPGRYAEVDENGARLARAKVVGKKRTRRIRSSESSFVGSDEAKSPTSISFGRRKARSSIVVLVELPGVSNIRQPQGRSAGKDIIKVNSHRIAAAAAARRAASSPVRRFASLLQSDGSSDEEEIVHSPNDAAAAYESAASEEASSEADHASSDVAASESSASFSQVLASPPRPLQLSPSFLAGLPEIIKSNNNISSNANAGLVSASAQASIIKCGRRDPSPSAPHARADGPSHARSTQNQEQLKGKGKASTSNSSKPAKHGTKKSKSSRKTRLPGF